jgi:SAM-dependent methyltransferase
MTDQRLDGTTEGRLRQLLRLPPRAMAERLAQAARRRLGRGHRPRPGRVRFGDLRRTTPLSDHFGYDRGTPVDRVYIEDFLARHAAFIRGRVLEIGDNSYSLRFGGTAVTRSDVLHVDAGNPHATYVGDLAEGAGLPDAAFDCIVLTQTLHLIFETPNAIATVHRILAPGGSLLATVPGVSSIDTGEWGPSWHWSFTPLSLGRMLAERFGEANVAVEVHGSVLTAAAFLYGLAAEELSAAELAVRDPRYPVVVAARAVKAEALAR